MNITFERIAAALAILGGVQDEEKLREMVNEQTQDETLADRICDEYRRIKPLVEEG